jgi:hypothetical protein
LDQAGNFAVAKTGVLEGRGDDPLLDVRCNHGGASALMRDLGAGLEDGLNSVDTLEPDVEKSGIHSKQLKFSALAPPIEIILSVSVMHTERIR